MSSARSDMLSPHGSDVSTGAGSSSGISSETALNDALLICQIRIQGQRAYREYETQGDIKALEAAIQYFRLAMDMTEDNSPEKAATLANLSVSLCSRYKSMGQPQDIEESISLAQLANALTPDESPNKHKRLTTIACALVSRFEQEGKLEDLEGAIGSWAHAVELVPDSHTDNPSLLNNLASSLSIRFQLSGRPDDLDKAISLQSHAVDLTPDGNPHKPMWLTNLGNSLSIRFEQSGHLEDIEKAIVLHGQSVDLTPDGDPNKLSRLNNAGNSLQARFDRLGTLDDLLQAIHLRSHAVNMSPDSHPGKPILLNNLATSLENRYERAGDVKDLEQAIAHQSRAVALTADGHPDKPSWLNNFATKLHTRFKHSGSLADLNAAIADYSTAVMLTPEGNPSKQSWLHNLSHALQQRFNRVGDTADLDDAIRHSTRSVELLSENHTNRATMLRLLGQLFLARLRSPHVHADDATHAMQAFHIAMLHPNSHPRERLLASSQYADFLTEFPHLLPLSLPLSLLDTYKHAIDLIPQCIWLGNDVRSRYTSKELQSVRLVVDNAATAAIVAGEYGLALEWLETGRAVVWSQVLQLRTPLDDLQCDHPLLADNLLRVSQALQSAASSVGPPTSTRSHSITLSLDGDTQSSHSHVLEYESLLTKIRGLAGFEGFMRPKTLPQLASACAAGPVVIINVHQSRCDALVLCHSGDVVHVPLPDFSLTQALGLQTLMWDFLKSSHLLSRWRSDNMRDELEALDDRGLKPRGLVVKPIIDVVCTSVSNSPLPHITWCPTGPLSFLPLHAAGIYPKDENDTTLSETIVDVAVSSYTPTLEALLKLRTKTIVNDMCPRTLIVSQPNTPGCSPISGTTEEAAIITSLLDLPSSTILNDAEGTVNAVLEGMATHDWVHLACHGVQDSDDPLKSAFRLYNGRLTLEMLMSKHLPNADLAVLSACQTATGDLKLPEEAVHLAAGMLNIGYKSVVGTMWSIYDSSAPLVMGEFYRVMAEQVKAGGELQPAYALHEATKALRAKYGDTDFVRWIPFVHFGL